MITEADAYASIWEGTAAECLARVIGATGSAIVPGDVSSITYRVYDLDGTTPTIAVASGTCTVGSVVYGALQTDSRWRDQYGNTVDSTGYNFAHTITSTQVPDGDHRYRVEYKFTMTDTSVLRVVFSIATKEAWTD